jgi:hypothetical protein
VGLRRRDRSLALDQARVAAARTAAASGVSERAAYVGPARYMGGIAVFILGNRLDPAGIPVPRLAVLGAAGE